MITGNMALGDSMSRRNTAPEAIATAWPPQSASWR